MRSGRSLAPKVLPLLLIVLLATATAGCKPGPWNLWHAYSARFIDGQGRVIDPQGGDRTTSEGQSYALFFALADNDRAQFDRVLAWTQQNLSNGNIADRLPGWLWGKAPGGQWRLLDPNSASDSDCWIAYSLIEAGRLWHEPSYTTLGRRMLANIAGQEVTDLPGFGLMLMPGPTQLWVHNHAWTVNPSYLPLFLFDRFAQLDPSGPWGAISMNIPRLLRQGARRGFAMDWLDYSPGRGFYPSPGPGAGSTGKSSQPAVGSYDAIRVYLWGGMQDSTGSMRPAVLEALPGMAGYLADHGAPPEKVNANGAPLPQDGPIGFSAALLPYLKAFPRTEKIAAVQRDRMSTQLDTATGLYGKNPAYFDQNLVLFATGFLDERFAFGAHGKLMVEWNQG